MCSTCDVPLCKRPSFDEQCCFLLFHKAETFFDPRFGEAQSIQASVRSHGNQHAPPLSLTCLLGLREGRWCCRLPHGMIMMMTWLQEIPAVVTMTKAVLSILQVIVGCAVQLPYPKRAQDGTVCCNKNRSSILCAIALSMK
jgi:hypothetical protein